MRRGQNFELENSRWLIKVTDKSVGFWQKLPVYR